MQAFIAGSHAPYVSRVVRLPWFSNYHILGRIYSNMGTMSHLADEFELGYDMYELSARSFYKADDTTAYYYALNAMALQFAEQNMHDETLSLLGKIEMECADANVLTKTWETKAILYKNLAQYDSAIYAAGQLYSNGYSAASGYVTMAQSYEHLGQLDSALFYAQRVLAMPNASDKERYNMLYFFVYHDSSAGEEEKMKRYEERADIDNKNIDPVQEQLVLSVEVLRQDLDKKPHYMYLCFVLASIGLIVGVAWIAKTHVKRITKIEQKKHQQLTKQNANILADMSRLQANNDALRQENADLSVLHSERRAELMAQIVNNCDAIRNSEKWKDVFYWNKHDKLCEVADKHFNLLSTKLQMLEVLNEREIHLCILVTIGNFSDKQLAQLLNYSEKSIRSIKLNAAKKLGTTSAHLHDFLMQKATE
jgi:DNA-binding CsgD family transcriptional regulator